MTSHPLPRQTIIRITCKYIKEGYNPLPILLSQTDHPEDAVIVMEKDPRDHIHACISARYTEKTIRKNLDKILTESGNSAKSVSLLKDEPVKCRAYAVKQVKKGANVLHIGNDWDLNKLQSHYDNLPSERKKQCCPDTCVSDIEEWMKETTGNTKVETPVCAISIVQAYYCEKCKPMNKARVAQIAHTIWLRQNPGQYRDTALDILDNHLPEFSTLNYRLESSLDSADKATKAHTLWYAKQQKWLAIELEKKELHKGRVAHLEEEMASLYKKNYDLDIG